MAALVAVVLAAVVTAAGSTYDAVEPVAYLWAVGFGLLMLVRRDRPLLVLALTTVGFFSMKFDSASIDSSITVTETRIATTITHITVVNPTAARMLSTLNARSVRFSITTVIQKPMGFFPPPSAWWSSFFVK